MLRSGCKCLSRPARYIGSATTTTQSSVGGGSSVWTLGGHYHGGEHLHVSMVILFTEAKVERRDHHEEKSTYSSLKCIVFWYWELFHCNITWLFVQYFHLELCFNIVSYGASDEVSWGQERWGCGKHHFQHDDRWLCRWRSGWSMTMLMSRRVKN